MNLLKYTYPHSFLTEKCHCETFSFFSSMILLSKNTIVPVKGGGAEESHYNLKDATRRPMEIGWAIEGNLLNWILN